MEIENIQDLYFLLTSISSVVILTLSFLLACIRLPLNYSGRKINIARKYLATSYFILGASGLLSCAFPTEYTNTTELLLTTACIASFQSLFFTTTHIVFMQPDLLNHKKIGRHIALIFLWVVALVCSYQYLQLPRYLLLSFIIIPYLAQQIYYTIKFHQIHQLCIQKMKDYYDEEQASRLRWLTYSFGSALTVGLLSIVASVSDLWVYSFFIITYTLFYTYMVVLVYNNQLFAKVTISAVVPATPPVFSETENRQTDSSTEICEEDAKDSNYQDFKENLSHWISEKGYMQKDLSVDEIAILLKTNRDYLRYFFRTYIHSDFRTWRSELRISEAKKIMMAHPEYSFTKISEIVGFNHRANFFNQFQKIEGMTPSEWQHLRKDSDKEN